MRQNKINPDLYGEVQKLGAKDMELCMQCGNCASACPLSAGENTFPRKIYRYLQLGLEDKLLEAPEPWLCYYCGSCNTDCPRGAEPAETMMATRRWLMTQYDWTGLARRFYASPKLTVGAFLGIALFVVLLFLLFHGPVITDRVELTTFAPVHLVHIGDKIMVTFIFVILLSNAAYMYRRIMQGTKIPLSLYIAQAPTFFINYFTQKRWRKCGTGPGSAWWRHILLFSGWVAMEILVMGFLAEFQTDKVHPFWHWTRLLGYYATIALLAGATTMLYSRLFLKEEHLHRYSDFMDVFFLVLIISVATTGIMVHFARMAGLPMMTYTIYVIHVAISAGMLTLMIPFGKLSHLMYRPLAIFLTTLKEKALRPSLVSLAVVKKDIGENFQSCMQCGTCTGVCPYNATTTYSPRKVLRDVALDRPSNVAVDDASWTCTTCNSCGEHCPRGIELLDLNRSIRTHVAAAGQLPKSFAPALQSLQQEGNPWGSRRPQRREWAKDAGLPAFTPDQEYCLFVCCTTAFDTGFGKGSQQAGLALVQLLNFAGVSYGTLGIQESCCGDLADKIGAAPVAAELVKKNTQMFQNAGVRNIVTLSPHCLEAFRKNYPDLKDIATLPAVELLDDLMQQGIITPTQRLDLRVTYHDPCYLGRHAGIYEAPRRILSAIPGLTLVEMQNHRERSFCCGGGGGGPWKERVGGMESLGEIRIQEALATGAEVIATACPYCIRMLNDAVARMGVGKMIKVQEVAQVLLQAVDLTQARPGTGKTLIGDVAKLSQEDLHV